MTTINNIDSLDLMYPEVFDKQFNREIDDFQRIGEFLNPDTELEEFSFDLQNLISHSINGIQPTVVSGGSSVKLNIPRQATITNEQNCDSPGIFINGSYGAVDHSELKPSITELSPGWFVPSSAEDKGTLTYMTKFQGDKSTWHEPTTVKSEDFGRRSPCQTVPRSYSNVPSPNNSVGSYTHQFESSPSSPRSRIGSFSSLPTTVVNADQTFLEIPRQKPGRKPSGKPNSNNRKRHVAKGTPEYVNKRCRNNVAVRKSREKAKLKQQGTESRVSDLTQDNRNLQKKVELLTKELSVLRGLFVNVGATLPVNIDELLRK